MLTSNRIKALQGVHLGFCSSVFLLGLVGFLIIEGPIQFELIPQKIEPLHIIGPIIALLGLLLGPFLFNKIIADMDPDTSTLAKFTKYQTAFLIRSAFLEAGALFNLVAFILSSNLLFVLLAACCFTALCLSRPTKDKVYTALQLQDTDRY